MSWSTILSLLGILWSSASPMIKAAALAELKTLETTEAGKPVLLFLIREAETMLAAAPVA